MHKQGGTHGVSDLPVCACLRVVCHGGEICYLFTLYAGSVIRPTPLRHSHSRVCRRLDSTRTVVELYVKYRMYVYGDQGIALGPYITYKYIRLYGLIRNQLARKLKLLAVPLADPHTPGARAQAPGQVSVNHKQLLEQ